MKNYKSMQSTENFVYGHAMSLPFTNHWPQIQVESPEIWMNARSNGRICQNPFLNIVEPVISEAQYSSFIISSTGLQNVTW